MHLPARVHVCSPFAARSIPPIASSMSRCPRWRRLIFSPNSGQIDRFSGAVDSNDLGEPTLGPFRWIIALDLKGPEDKAKRMRDRFFPKEAINPDKVVGLDTIVQDAVTLKFTPRPPTAAQLAEFIQIPPR
jgi:hypothetical protein